MEQWAGAYASITKIVKDSDRVNAVDSGGLPVLAMPRHYRNVRRVVVDIYKFMGRLNNA